jgi:hypothetical protein
MVRINIEIPQQAFELVRERIGLILKEEISNQVLYYRPDIDAAIWMERSTAFNDSELQEGPQVNVSMDRGSYDNKDVNGVDGSYTYNIDVYAQSKTTSAAWGDYNANIIVQKLLGICRYILDNPVYKTLAFTPPFIERVNVGEIRMATPGNLDADNVRMGRLTLNVRVAENEALLTANAIAGYESSVKLYETEKGYVFTKLN